MEAPQRVYDALDARNYKTALKLCDKNAKKNPVLAALRCLTLQRMRRLSEAAEACNDLVTKGYTDEKPVRTAVGARASLRWPCAAAQLVHEPGEVFF